MNFDEQEEEESEVRPPRDVSSLLRLLGGMLLVFSAGLLLLLPFLLSATDGHPAYRIAAPAQILPGVILLAYLGMGLWRRDPTARLLTVVAAFIALAKGVLLTLKFSEQFPVILGQIAEAETPPPADAIESLRVIVPLMAASLYLFLPGFFLWICAGNSARHTCSLSGKPLPGWANAPAPLLVLGALFVWEGIQLPSFAAFNGAVPAFGGVLSGPVGGTLLLGCSLLLLRIGYGLIQAESLSLWLAVGLTALAAVSFSLSNTPPLLTALHTAMGFSQEQIAMFNKLQDDPWNIKWRGAAAVAVLAALLYAARFLRSTPEEE